MFKQPNTHYNRLKNEERTVYWFAFRTNVKIHFIFSFDTCTLSSPNTIRLPAHSSTFDICKWLCVFLVFLFFAIFNFDAVKADSFIAALFCHDAKYERWMANDDELNGCTEKVKHRHQMSDEVPTVNACNRWQIRRCRCCCLFDLRTQIRLKDLFIEGKKVDVTLARRCRVQRLVDGMSK